MAAQAQLGVARVAASATERVVPAGAADEVVGTVPADEDVVPRAAEQAVGAAPPEEDVPAPESADDVVARRAEEQVRPGGAGDRAADRGRSVPGGHPAVVVGRRRLHRILATEG